MERDGRTKGRKEENKNLRERKRGNLQVYVKEDKTSRQVVTRLDVYVCEFGQFHEWSVFLKVNCPSRKVSFLNNSMSNFFFFLNVFLYRDFGKPIPSPHYYDEDQITVFLDRNAILL